MAARHLVGSTRVLEYPYRMYTVHGAILQEPGRRLTANLLLKISRIPLGREEDSDAIILVVPQTKKSRILRVV